MRIGLNRNMAMLQMEQTENSQAVRDNVLDARSRQSQAKIDQMNTNNEAQGLRAEGENIRNGCNAAATSLGVAAAVCAVVIPQPFGAIVGAIIAAIAAVVMLIGTIMAQAKEREAAAKEKQATLKDLTAEQFKNKADEIKKEDQDRQQYVEQTREKFAEVLKESTQAQKF
jgi:hypothetical protein